MSKSCDVLFSLYPIIVKALALLYKAHIVALNISRTISVVFGILIQPSDALAGHFLEHLSWIS